MNAMKAPENQWHQFKAETQNAQHEPRTGRHHILDRRLELVFSSTLHVKLIP